MRCDVLIKRMLKKKDFCLTLWRIYHVYMSTLKAFQKHDFFFTGPRSAVGNVSGYRCVSDCRSRGREFDPGPVPSFRGE